MNTPTNVQVSRITVTYGGLVPTQPYGNIGINATWEADVLPGASPEAATQELFGRIREQIIQAVTPIAQARLAQVEVLLSTLPKKEAEEMRQKLGAIEWLSVAAPEAALAASLPAQAEPVQEAS